LDNFNDDDFYQGQTNAKGHYVYAAFGLMKHVSIALSWFHANTISVNTIAAGTTQGAKQPEDRLFADVRVVW